MQNLRADGWPVESNDSTLQEWVVILLSAQAEEHYKCLYNIARLATSPLRTHSVNHPGEDSLPPVTLPKFGLSHRTCRGTVHDSMLIPPSRRKISFVITNARSRLAALATLFLWRHAPTLQHHYETCTSIAAALENLLPQIHFQTDMHSMADLWVRAMVNGLGFSGMLLRGWGEIWGGVSESRGKRQGQCWWRCIKSITWYHSLLPWRTSGHFILSIYKKK